MDVDDVPALEEAGEEDDADSVAVSGVSLDFEASSTSLAPPVVGTSVSVGEASSCDDLDELD